MTAVPTSARSKRRPEGAAATEQVNTGGALENVLPRLYPLTYGWSELAWGGNCERAGVGHGFVSVTL